LDARPGRRSPPGEVAQDHGIIVELLHSAIAWTIDYISTAHHPMAKRAKDMASAAVFLGYVNCVVVWGIIIFFNWHRIEQLEFLR